MILITDVRVMETDKREVKWLSADIPDVWSSEDKIQHIEHELIRSTCFTNKNGMRIHIGATREVQNFLGLPFEVFENQEKIIDEQRVALKKWNELSFVDHVKFAFRKLIK